MGASLTLFKLSGIDVRVHWSFILILAYGAYSYSIDATNPLAGALYGVLVILLLFVCVTLHEFGHALVAQHYKVKVPHITLLPIGGVASLERIPDKPLQEFLIAIAGPLVNFAIAGLLFPILLIVRSFTAGASVALFNARELMEQMQTPGLGSLLVYLVLTNLGLGLFNLLPAFPMDGGRVLRALLAMGTSYLQATRTAVFIGRLMAVLFAIWGILNGNMFLLLIAFFVYVGGGSERENVESRTVLRDIQVDSALTRTAVNLYTSERADRAVDLIMSSYQTDYPVMDLSGRFVGVLTRGRLIYGLKEIGTEARIVDIMLRAEEIPTCTSTDNLAAVWETMVNSASRVVAVKDGSEFKGLLTSDDITEVLQVIAAKLEGVDRNAPPNDVIKPPSGMVDV